MADIMYMGKPVAGSIPIDDTEADLHKVYSSAKVDRGIAYYTDPVVQTNGTVTFDDLNPNYKYEIVWETVDANGVDAVDPSGSDHIEKPSYTKFSKTAGTHSTEANPTSKLVYTISGGTDGVTRFRLEYFKCQ